jgi:hypothetical protein
MASCLMAPSGILLDQLRQLELLRALGHGARSKLPNSTPDPPIKKSVPVCKSAMCNSAFKAAKAKGAKKAKELKAKTSKAKPKAKAAKAVPQAAKSRTKAAARALGRGHGVKVLLKTKDEQSARVSQKNCNEEKSETTVLQVCAAECCVSHSP